MKIDATEWKNNKYQRDADVPRKRWAEGRDYVLY